MNVLRMPQSEGLKHRKLGASALECLRAGYTQNKGYGFSPELEGNGILQ